MKTFFGIAILVISWWIASHVFDLSMVLPTPEEVVVNLVEELSSADFYNSILSTFTKSVLVIFSTLAIGVPIGFVMGLSETLYDVLRPLILIMQSVPVISWLALVVFTWGIGWKGPVAIGIVSLLPSVVFNTIEGVRSVDRDLVEMAKVYRIPRSKVLRYIYLGSMVPFILASLELVIGGVWKVVLVAEFLCGDSGIGVEIAWARQFVDVPGVYALTLVGVSLGMASERLVKVLVRRLEARWGLC